MNQAEKKAINIFRSGFNCAQSVLSAYSEKIGFDEKFATDISSGFGGGMGKLQETCGAVTGAFMVIGIQNSKSIPDVEIRKEQTTAMIQQFSEKFKSIHGSTNCKTLLNSDLKTEEGQAYIKLNKLNESVCEKCIADSIRIIEELK